MKIRNLLVFICLGILIIGLFGCSPSQSFRAYGEGDTYNIPNKYDITLENTKMATQLEINDEVFKVDENKTYFIINITIKSLKQDLNLNTETIYVQSGINENQEINKYLPETNLTNKLNDFLLNDVTIIKDASKTFDVVFEVDIPKNDEVITINILDTYLYIKNKVY